MAGNVASFSNIGVQTSSQPLSKAGSERQIQREVGDLGKALAASNVAGAQTAVNSLKNAAPTQDGRLDFQNAVKALDQALKSNDVKGAREAFSELQRAQQLRSAQESPRAERAQQQQPQRGDGADQTRSRQDAGQASQARAAAQQAFLTRQDLLDKNAAEPVERTEPGRLVDVRA